MRSSSLLSANIYFFIISCLLLLLRSIIKAKPVVAGNRHKLCESSTRDIVLHTKNNSFTKISELHRSYDPLQYPILFPFGTDGYHIYLKGTTGRKITMSQYYSYHLMVRDGNYWLKVKRLFQQFLVDIYAKIETERLQLLRREQQSLCVDNYNSLRDSLLASDGNPNRVGQRVVLPATYTGGPRYLHERQMNAMAYVK